MLARSRKAPHQRPYIRLQPVPCRCVGSDANSDYVRLDRREESVYAPLGERFYTEVIHPIARWHVMQELRLSIGAERQNKRVTGGTPQDENIQPIRLMPEVCNQRRKY
jgi:hypothetical protein